MRQEQLQKRHGRKVEEQPMGTFPEVSRTISGGSDAPDDADEVLRQIDRELKASTVKALGEATGIETD